MKGIGIIDILLHYRSNTAIVITISVASELWTTVTIVQYRPVYNDLIYYDLYYVYVN